MHRERFDEDRIDFEPVRTGRPGRPSRLGNPHVLKMILRAVSRGMSQLSAAYLAGIDETNFYQWRNRDPEFRQALMKARARGTKLASDVVCDIMMQTGAGVAAPAHVRLRAATFQLIHRSPEYKQQLTAEGQDEIVDPDESFL